MSDESIPNVQPQPPMPADATTRPEPLTLPPIPVSFLPSPDYRFEPSRAAVATAVSDAYVGAYRIPAGASRYAQERMPGVSYGSDAYRREINRLIARGER